MWKWNLLWSVTNKTEQQTNKLKFRKQENHEHPSSWKSKSSDSITTRKCRKLDSVLTENFHLNMEMFQPCLASLHVNRQCCISDEKVRSRVLITIKLVSYWRYIGNLKDEKCKMNPEICRRTNLLNEYMSKQQSDDYERSILFKIQAIMNCWFSSRTIPTLLNLSVFAFWWMAMNHDGFTHTNSDTRSSQSPRH